MNKEALETILNTKDNLQFQLDAMLQRYYQATNPEENAERIYLQDMLTNLVRNDDHFIDQSGAIQEETIILLEQKLSQMGFNVEEFKLTQPQFFEMILLCYQANMERLQRQIGQ